MIQKFLLLALLTLFFSSLVAAGHIQEQKLFDESLQLLFDVHDLAREQFYKTQSGCFRYPYGPCQYDLAVYRIPGYGADYPYLKHYLQYHRIYAHPLV